MASASMLPAFMKMLWFSTPFSRRAQGAGPSSRAASNTAHSYMQSSGSPPWITPPAISIRSPGPATTSRSSMYRLSRPLRT